MPGLTLSSHDGRIGTTSLPFDAMRVLFVSPSAGLGGAERALVEGCRALLTVAPDWPLGLIALEDGPLIAEAQSLGVEASVLPLPQQFAATGEWGRRRLATWLRLASSGRAAVGYSRRLREAIGRFGPDVVHSNGIKTHVLAAWAIGGRLPLVWHVHDYLSSRRASAPLLRLHRRQVALVLTNSESVKADVVRVLGRHVRIQTVYNAVDVDRFSPEGSRIDLDAAAGLPPAPPETLRVGLVATFARWKGHEVFLRALAGVPERPAVRGYVIGGPVYRTGSASQVTLGELTALALALGLGDRVGFTGLLADSSEAMRALDVVVHASTAPEPFGLSIAEAMACGRAVVISEAGGALEVGDPERTCLAAPPGDVLALTRQIGRLLDDKGLRERLGREAAADVRTRFTHHKMGEALGAAYRSIAGRPTESAPA